MKKPVKIILWTLLVIIVLAVGAGALFIYKVMYGFPVSYETEVPVIEFPANRTSVLLFSKSTGFRHGESIDAGKEGFEKLARENNWFLYSTVEGGVFNAEQLKKFDVVIFNNCTGRLLNDDQKKVLADYVMNGGHWMGIHGAGDNSHHWDWYEKNLVGAPFSHHAIKKHIQEANITINRVADSSLVKDVKNWSHADEWYVFSENPGNNGFNLVCTIDGEKIDPNGNFLWMKNKNFGMGKDHPVAWYKKTGNGRSFYTSIGHDATAWKQESFLKLLENEVNSSGTRQKNN